MDEESDGGDELLEDFTDGEELLGEALALFNCSCSSCSGVVSTTSSCMASGGLVSSWLMGSSEVSVSSTWKAFLKNRDK